MREHELLVRHTARWAASSSAPFDGGLLEEMLDRRGHAGRRPPQHWPPGTGRAVARSSWPRPPSIKEAERLVATMGTFWSFLRDTGRLSPTSAAPEDLAREVRRHVRRQAARATREERAKVFADVMAQIERQHAAARGGSTSRPSR